MLKSDEEIDSSQTSKLNLSFLKPEILTSSFLSLPRPPTPPTRIFPTQANIELCVSKQNFVFYRWFFKDFLVLVFEGC